MAQDPYLAFAENFANRFIQYKMIQRQEATENRRFEIAERREARYDKQLQANRLFRQRTEKRLEAGTASLIAERGKPDRGTKAHFEGLGYPEEEAQRLQDIETGHISKPMTAYQKVTSGKMMMENPLTSDMYESGKLIMEEGMRELQGRQKTFPSKGITRPDTGTIPGQPTNFYAPQTTLPRLTEQQTQDFLPPNFNTQKFDRQGNFTNRYGGEEDLSNLSEEELRKLAGIE